MMPVRSMLLVVMVSLLARPLLSRAQEDAPSLGEIARDLKRKKAEQQATPTQGVAPPRSDLTVIDNDNLSEAMEAVHQARPTVESKAVFSVDPSGAVRFKSPDVSCSLSFNGRSSASFVRPVLIEDLPLDELVKLDGPGSIQDQSLQLEVFNGTEWELREITVGLTLERKPGENAELAARARVIPAAEGIASATVERHADVTLLYHLKADAKPFSRTQFSERIGITPTSDEDWRWSIVEAKGIRPSTVFAPESLSQPLFGDPLPFVPATNRPSDVSQPSPPLRPADRQEPGPGKE